MAKNQTHIWDVSDPEHSKKSFAFDYSYWSHDAFHIDETGLCVPDKPNYADQKQVFEDLGRGVLSNAFQGHAPT